MKQIRCPECDQKVKIDESRSRSVVRCSSCGHRIPLDDPPEERVTARPPRNKKSEPRRPPSQEKLLAALLPFGIVLVVGIMFQMPILLNPALGLLAMLVGFGIIIYGFVQACLIASRQGYHVSIDYLETMGPLKWVVILGFFGLYVLGYWLQWVIGHVVIATRKPKAMLPWLAVQGYGIVVMVMAVIVGTISDRAWRAVYDAASAVQAGQPTDDPHKNTPKPAPTPAPRVTGDADIDRLLADLDSKDAATFNAAAERLAKMEPNQHQAVVANKLAAKIDGLAAYPRSLTVAALKVWATPNEIPLLIRLLGDQDVNTRNEVLQVIGKFQDERTVQPVVRCFVEFQTRYHGERALRDLGPVAEKDVAALLNQPDRGMLIPAIDVLEVIGTEKSVPALEAATRDQDLGVQAHARQALAAIKGRKKM